MIKTLKITTLAAAVLCVVLVVCVTALGLKGDPEIEKFLDSPSVIEELKKVLGQSATSADQKSPLVTYAQMFADRIDPPPPLKPPVDNRKPVKPPVPTNTGVASRPPEVKGPVNTSSKFDLIATCRYDDEPGKSMALLSLPAKGLRWVRVGESIGHLMIADITDGGLVMAQASGTEDVVVMKQTPSTIRTLLAEEGFDPEQASTYAPTPAVTAGGLGRGNAYFVPKNAGGATRTYTPGSSTRRPTTTTMRRSSAYVPPVRTRKVPPKPTLEQRKAALDDNISDIKEIIKKPGAPATDEKASKDQDALMKLLQLLENERKAADKEVKKPAGGAAQKE